MKENIFSFDELGKIKFKKCLILLLPLMFFSFVNSLPKEEKHNAGDAIFQGEYRNTGDAIPRGEYRNAEDAIPQGEYRNAEDAIPQGEYRNAGGAMQIGAIPEADLLKVIYDPPLLNKNYGSAVTKSSFILSQSGRLTSALGVTTSPLSVTTSALGVTTSAMGLTTSYLGVTTSALDVTTSPLSVTTSALDVTASPPSVTTSALGVTTSAPGLKTLGVKKRRRNILADSIGERTARDTALPLVSSSSRKWKKNTLTWKLITPSRKLPERDQREILEMAFDLWTRVTNLKIKENTGSGLADIAIIFARGHHRDENPFDGKGKVLAHAFPPSDHPVGGDIHFDEDEHWISGEGDGLSMMTVAAHEMGHALGLGHLPYPDALMYRGYGLTNELSQEDIEEIQKLYGKRDSTPTQTPRRTTTRAPLITTKRSGPKTTSTPIDCSTQFDVVLYEKENCYTGIKDNLVYRFIPNGMLNDYPKKLDEVYPHAPREAQAVFNVPETRDTYFLKGSQVWKYTNDSLQKDFPKRLDQNHFRSFVKFVLPMSDTEESSTRFFVFSNDNYWWDYNFDNPPNSEVRKFSVKVHWPFILQNDVKYAVTTDDNKIYLMSRNGHLIVNRFRQVQGQAQPGVPDWMRNACQKIYAFESGAKQNNANRMTPALLFLLTFVLHH